MNLITSPTRIDCGSFVLRRWNIDDKQALIRNANNRNVSRNLRDLFPYPYTDRDAERWLAHADADRGVPWLYAIEVDGEAAGGISLETKADVECHSAELGYWLGEPFWGRGVTTAAVRAITGHAFLESEIYRIFAYVFARNTASMRVLEKAGYQREGVLRRGIVKDGVLMDLVMYAMTRDPGLPYVSAPLHSLTDAERGKDLGKDVVGQSLSSQLPQGGERTS
ncbi:MAG TPA: GNAT family protein [Blastocatellia bacterium]